MHLIGYVVVLFFILVPLHADKKIIIDISGQKAYILENKINIFSGRISSGKKGHRTPLGKFKILEKKRKHISNAWPKPKGGARMPYMMRLTRSGIAMHLGYVPKYPASHGCIRLKNGFAQKVYKWAQIGTVVEIVKRYKNRYRKVKKPGSLIPKKQKLYHFDRILKILTYPTEEMYLTMF